MEERDVVAEDYLNKLRRGYRRFIPVLSWMNPGSYKSGSTSSRASSSLAFAECNVSPEKPGVHS
ncbi:hypothetical protein [Alicyclobacillus sp. SO9]|uniref:hypothetical protein n=1 Tax=Alicyclobacillus sp. SO9 TaxID=2665646 RepID=UPI001E575E08|nr:hypothetical protein [Alicyclobacillus sp. SO9]